MKITRTKLEELIDDDTYFSRGQSYFEDGAVSLISIENDSMCEAFTL